jgi:hypothetical protein
MMPALSRWTTTTSAPIVPIIAIPVTPVIAISPAVIPVFSMPAPVVAITISTPRPPAMTQIIPVCLLDKT